MKICIRDRGISYLIEIPENIKIRDLKEKYIRASPFCELIYNGTILFDDDDERVCDYGIKENDIIVSSGPYVGGGPLPTTHICPYGCGRQIPDDYKGCTELLQAKPNYFG